MPSLATAANEKKVIFAKSNCMMTASGGRASGAAAGDVLIRI